MTPEQAHKLRIYVGARAMECDAAHQEVESAAGWMRGTMERTERVIAGDTFYDGKGHGARLDLAVAQLALRRDILHRAVELAEAFDLDVADETMIWTTPEAMGKVK